MPGAPRCPSAARSPRPSRWTRLWQYLTLGYRHILPEGLDHILFVLGLFLLRAELRPVLVQVTTFTSPTR